MTGESEAIAVGRRPQPGGRPPAPGRLAVVQAFLNSHYDLENEPGAELLRSPTALVAWLRRAGVLIAPSEADDHDLRRALVVRHGLRALAQDGIGRPRLLDVAAHGSGVEVRVAPGGELQFVAAPAGRRRGRTRRAAGDRTAPCRRELVTDEGLPGRSLRLGVLRRLAEPLGALVLDVGMRRTGEGTHATIIAAAPQRRRELRRLRATLQLVAARARRRPGRWLWPVLGLALAVAFACAVAGEATIAGDRARAGGRVAGLDADGAPSPGTDLTTAALRAPSTVRPGHCWRPGAGGADTRPCCSTRCA